MSNIQTRIFSVRSRDFKNVTQALLLNRTSNRPVIRPFLIYREDRCTKALLNHVSIEGLFDYYYSSTRLAAISESARLEMFQGFKDLSVDKTPPERKRFLLNWRKFGKRLSNVRLALITFSL